MKKLKENLGIWVTIFSCVMTIVAMLFTQELKKLIMENWRVIVIMVASIILLSAIIVLVVKTTFKKEWGKVEKRFSDLEDTFNGKWKQVDLDFAALQNTFTDVTIINSINTLLISCLLYTSDAADE